MMLPLVSPMEPSDLDTIMPLERQAFADPWTRRQYSNDLAENPLATYRVIRPANSSTLPSILAWGGFWLLVDEAHIATVAVHPDFRGCGLGQLLMVDLMDEAQAQGARVATLEVRAGNLLAQKLYAKLGFDVVGTRRKYYRDAEDDADYDHTRAERSGDHFPAAGRGQDARARLIRRFGDVG